MRFYIRLLVFSVFSFSSVGSFASILTSWGGKQTAAVPDGRYSSPELACKSYNTALIVTAGFTADQRFCKYENSSQTIWTINKGTVTCQYGDNGTQCNASCPSPNVLTAGQCVAPAPDQCASKKDQPTKYFKKYPSFADYKIAVNLSQDGCSVSIGSWDCGTNGATGEFACWGIGTYTGTSLAPSDGSDVNGCTDCKPPEPVTSTNSQQCTPNADSTTTCVTESGSTEFAAGECHVGSTGGATGLVCVKPDYVPEAATNKRTDVIKTEATADGGSKTTTTSTSENKHCVEGKCSSTTTTTTTTTTKDGSGKVTGETSSCSGSKCAGPTDETEPEDEGMGEAKFTAKGGCEGSDCDVDAFNPFGTDVVPGYSDSLNAALSGIKLSPIGSAVSNIRWPTGGSCPVYSMQLFNSSISITEHCTVWESVGSALRAVFLAIWAFAAVRVFLSA